MAEQWRDTTGADGPGAPELAAQVYENLRRLAAAQLNGSGPRLNLQPTAIVHEAYLRLADQSRVDWQGRTHFFAMGAEMIRRVLVDAARAQAAQKRGHGWERVTLTGVEAIANEEEEDIEALDGALQRLAAVDPRAARVVELRFFGGLGEAEIGELLGVSERTVRNDWRAARAWLRGALGGGGGERG